MQWLVGVVDWVHGLLTFSEIVQRRQYIESLCVWCQGGRQVGVGALMCVRVYTQTP